MTQEYIFIDYSNSPSHEPTGDLQAARLYPLLRFTLTAPEKKEKAPKYLRIDYRFELALDMLIENPHSLSTASKLSQAGIFQDNDSPSYFKVPFKGMGEIFDRGEKPLKYEVIGEGLNHGKKGKWDNIHYWSYKKDELPSTPGAYYAAHIHWRWFPAASDPNRFLLSGAGSQYSGISGAGTALIDRTNPDQNLYFAIAESSRWPNEQDWNSLPFDFLDKLSNDKDNLPRSIENGSNLVLWVSIEVSRNLKEYPLDKDWTGTVFVNGMFFAHNKEPQIPRLLGFRKPFYKNPENVSQQWTRPPDQSR